LVVSAWRGGDFRAWVDDSLVFELPPQPAIVTRTRALAASGRSKATLRFKFASRGSYKAISAHSARSLYPRQNHASAAVFSFEMKGSSVPDERTLMRTGGALTVALALLLSACGGNAHPKAQRHAARTTATTSTARAATTAQSKRHPASHTRVLHPPFRIGSIALTLTEPSPAAIATTRTPAGASVRVLPTVIRYPATGSPNGRANAGATPASAAGPFPLLVFSQGYDMPAAAYSWLMNAWTSAGYVVAAPTYPRTDPTSPGGPDEADIVNHPADLRSVIASLRKPHILGAKSITGLIDTTRVAVIGQSDGGDVSLAVAAGSCCRDRTVKAAVILSGAELEAFGGTYYTAGSVPLLVVQGSADTINPPGCSIELYDQAPRPKFYLELIGAQHLQPYVDSGRDRSLIAGAVLGFLRRYLKGRSSGLEELVRAGNAPPVASLIARATGPGAETYCPGAPAP
jgi:predicted dienelactone hydrolase